MVQGMSSDTAACWPSNPKSKQSVCQHVHFSWHTFQFVSKCRHFQGCSYCGCTSAPPAAAVHRDSVAKKSLLVTHLLWFKKKKKGTYLGKTTRTSNIIRAKAISHLNLQSNLILHLISYGLASCSVGAPPTDGQRFPFSITNIPVFPDFASELNPSLFTPKNAVKPSLAWNFDEMEAWEPLTETMQANYLAPQGQPSRSRQTHALEEGLCNTSATQLDR